MKWCVLGKQFNIDEVNWKLIDFTYASAAGRQIVRIRQNWKLGIRTIGKLICIELKIVKGMRMHKVQGRQQFIDCSTAPQVAMDGILFPCIQMFKLERFKNKLASARKKI